MLAPPRGSALRPIKLLHHILMFRAENLSRDQFAEINFLCPMKNHEAINIGQRARFGRNGMIDVGMRLDALMDGIADSLDGEYLGGQLIFLCAKRLFSHFPDARRCAIFGQAELIRIPAPALPMQDSV
jgi:hypothetical protein